MKKLGAMMLIAGTCIGSGMIALPMVLAKLGLVVSIFLMLLIWFIMYFTSLINVELNLQAGHGLPLGSLAKRFSGRAAEWIGTVSLKLLTYSLIAVFLYAGSSATQELITTHFNREFSFFSIASSYTLVVFIILLFPVRLIDYINRILFIGLLSIVGILIIALAFTIQWTNLPLFPASHQNIGAWTAIIPVVFTSFGFQVIFHTLTNYCAKDAKMLKCAFFWGSLIPAIVYIIWTSSVLSVVHHNNPPFYQLMIQNRVEVGELIQVLSTIAHIQTVQLLVWIISLLAIATSVLGVGMGLSESLEEMMSKVLQNYLLKRFFAIVIAILPAYLVVLFVPNAFITVLGFAGMILSVIAVLLPTYLFWKIKSVDLHYPELQKTWIIVFCVIIAIAVMVFEGFDMYF